LECFGFYGGGLNDSEALREDKRGGIPYTLLFEILVHLLLH
jgi:hypothetical protein